MGEDPADFGIALQGAGENQVQPGTRQVTGKLQQLRRHLQVQLGSRRMHIRMDEHGSLTLIQFAHQFVECLISEELLAITRHQHDPISVQRVQGVDRFRAGVASKRQRHMGKESKASHVTLSEVCGVFIAAAGQVDEFALLQIDSGQHHRRNRGPDASPLHRTQRGFRSPVRCGVPGDSRDVMTLQGLAQRGTENVMVDIDSACGGPSFSGYRTGHFG
ncbi:hypothetical protein D9M69_398840 [compost metagenome]